MRPGLFKTLQKHASKLQPAPEHQEFLDEHFSVQPNWFLSLDSRSA